MVSIIFLTLTTLLFTAPTGSDPINQSPVVKLILAENVDTVAPGQQISFTVSVMDPEDGSSDYQEIPTNEVFVEIRHFKYNTIKEISKYEYNPSSGLSNIKAVGCFDCHQWKNDLVGPSFSKIKQSSQQKAINGLIGSLLQGSAGNWGNEMMPAQDIPETKAREIITWLVGEKSNNLVEISRGFDGLFTAETSIQEGHYLLTASYRDHGVGAERSDRKTGYHSVSLTITN